MRALALIMNIESYAKLLLEHWGVEVSGIPTSEKEESDFIAIFDTCTVLIEEKTKLDDPTMLARRKDVLSKGEIHSVSTPLRKNNRLSGIIGKAVSQLKSSSDNEHDYRLIWFTGKGINCLAQYEQFIATIYGTTKIVEMNQSHYITCYFFRYSDFYRFSKTIDGAIVAYASDSEITAKLCLNPLSPRFSTIKSSPLVTFFGDAVMDPVHLEKHGKAYIDDSKIDRNDPQSILRYLQSKYKTAPLMNMDLGHITATISVPNDGANN